MVIRLGRVRRGELPAPASWAQAAFLGDVLTIVRQLAPLWSSDGLLASLGREALRSEAVLVAYAVVWRGLRSCNAASTIRHHRGRDRIRALRGRG